MAIGNGAALTSGGGNVVRIANALTVGNSGALSVRASLYSSSYVIATGLTNNGAITVDGSYYSYTGPHACYLRINGDVTGSGSVSLNYYGVLEISGSVSGSGTINVTGLGYLTLSGAVAGATIAVSGSENVITIGRPASFGGSVTGFTTNNTIYLSGETVTDMSYAGTVLTATVSGGFTRSLNISGPFSGLRATADNRLVAVANDSSLDAANEILLLTSGTNVVRANTGTLNAGDKLIGQGGNNTLSLSGGGSFGLSNVVKFRSIALVAGADYTLTSADGTVAAGSVLGVDASGLSAVNTLTFNGATETDGAFGFIGGAGNDVLTGGAGNDVFNGRFGVDTMTGGAGKDTFYVDNPGDLVIEAAGGGADSVRALASYALAAGQEVEKLLASSATSTMALDLTGNEFGNAIYGNAGDNVIDGRAGADTMFGYGGADTYYVDDMGDRVIETAGGGADSVRALVSYALRAGQEIEKLLASNAASTVALDLTGNEFGNAIYGNAGANVIDGGAGTDTMFGYGGGDTYHVDDASDRVIEAAGGGSDVVRSTTTYGLGAGQEIEALVADSLTSTAAMDLTGNELANTIAGNAGDNVLNGKGGDDTMTGGAGNDTFYVDDTGDKVMEAAAGGSDSVRALTSYALGAGQEIEKLLASSATSTTAMDLRGNEFANAIYGNAGANMLAGGAGMDVLTGYGGSDTFLFDTAPGSGNIDRITDFEPTSMSAPHDIIALSQAIFDALPSGTLTANAFKDIGTGAEDADDRMLYNSANGALLYDADGVGGAAAVQFAAVGGGLALGNTDFRVV